jgi:hypothetical protein
MFKQFRLLLFFMCVANLSFGGKFEKGMEALKIYDYFKAKKLFYQAIKSHPAGAAYGLSTIYFRSDNPFHNIDSAFKYILLAEKKISGLKPAEKTNLGKYSIDTPHIRSLKVQITELAFERASREATVEAFDRFISTYTDSTGFRQGAIESRDKLAYARAYQTGSYEDIGRFVQTYPQAHQVPEAKERYELLLYKTLTRDSTETAYASFIGDHPESPYKFEAENILFAICAPRNSIEEYHAFLKKYPQNHNVDAAWHNIYTLFTSDFSSKSLKAFKEKFPDYPFQQTVNRDIHLAETCFYPARQNNRWGFVDSTGAELIGFVYEFIDRFSEGLAEVGLNGRSGFINKQGKIVIPIEYEEAEPYNGGLCIVKKNGKSGVINKMGKVVVPFLYEEIHDFSEGLAAVMKGEKFGYVNKEGREVIPCIYTSAQDFSEGLSVVEVDGSLGYINHNGALVISLQFEWAEKFSKGWARVKKTGKYGTINAKGEFVVPADYDLVNAFSEGFALVVKGKKFGFIDSTGKEVIDLDFDYSADIAASGGFKNGLAKIEVGKKKGFIDTHGKIVVPRDYEDIHYFSEGYAAVVRKGKWGYIDRKMHLKIDHDYEYAGDFHDGIARVRKGGMYGFIDKKGKTVLAFDYTEASDFDHGQSYVTKEGKQGILDKDGNFILNCEFDKIKPVEGADYLQVEKNGKMAYFRSQRGGFFWKEDGF